MRKQTQIMKIRHARGKDEPNIVFMYKTQNGKTKKKKNLKR